MQPLRSFTPRRLIHLSVLLRENALNRWERSLPEWRPSFRKKKQYRVGKPGPLYEIPPLVLELNEIDSPAVRPCSRGDEVALASKWSHDPELDRLVERVDAFKRELDTATRVWTDWSGVRTGKRPLRLNERDVVSVALLGSRKCGSGQTLNAGLLRAAGIPDRLVSDNDLVLHSVLHCFQRQQQYESEEKAHKDETANSSIEQLMEKVPRQVESEPGLGRLSRHFDTLAIAGTRYAHRTSHVKISRFLDLLRQTAAKLPTPDADLVLYATKNMLQDWDRYAMRSMSLVREVLGLPSEHGLDTTETLDALAKSRARILQSGHLSVLFEDYILLLASLGAFRVLWREWQQLQRSDVPRLPMLMHLFIWAVLRAFLVPEYDGRIVGDRKMKWNSARDRQKAARRGYSAVHWEAMCLNFLYNAKSALDAPNYTDTREHLRQLRQTAFVQGFLRPEGRLRPIRNKMGRSSRGGPDSGVK